MSELANWSYTSTATVYPFVDEDLFNGGALFGDPYTIACTWKFGGGAIRRTAGGQGGALGDEFVANMLVYTEDTRPTYRDEIVLDRVPGRMVIRSVDGAPNPFAPEQPYDRELAT